MLTPRLHIGLVALGLTVTLAVPGVAQAAVTTCPSQTATQVFVPWSDPGWYASVPDGGLEAGGAGWALQGGATVAAGNETFFVRSAADDLSLALPVGGSAASPPSCIGPGHPTLRFFVRNTGSQRAALQVTVEFADALGVRRSVPIGLINAAPQWAPSPLLPVTVNTLSLIALQQASFQFTPVDGGDWRVDDVYVDPYGKG